MSSTAPSGPKPPLGSYRAGCLAGGGFFGVVGILAGLALAELLVFGHTAPGEPLETLMAEGQQSTLASPNLTHASPHSPVGTMGVGDDRLRDQNFTRSGALGAGGREWPLVMMIGRHKAASTSLAHMMFETHLFCRPYTSQGKAFKEVRYLVDARNWARGLGWYLDHFGRDPRCSPEGQHPPRNASLHPGGLPLQRYVDATPDTFMKPNGLKHMKELLRDPSVNPLSSTLDLNPKP